MSNRRNARHRIDAPENNSMTTLVKVLGENAGGVGRQAAVVAAVSGLALTAGTSVNPTEATAAPQRIDVTNAENIAHLATTVSVPESVTISFEQPETSSLVEEPVQKAPEKAAVHVAPVASKVKPVAGKHASTKHPVVAPVQQQKPKPVAKVTAAPAVQKKEAPASRASAPKISRSGIGATILASAYGQLGITQDCTALVSNSLAAVGIHYHGWPAGYLALGRQVSAAEAQPGDIVYYADGGAGMAHVAIYAGGGKAIHGGWNGNQTVLQSVNVGSGPVFIAMGH